MLESHVCGTAPFFRQSWAITQSHDFGQSFGAFFPAARINIFLRELRLSLAHPAKPADRHKGIIFDLDGTLVDTVPDLAIAADRTLADLGHNPAGEARVRDCLGNGASELVEGALVHYGYNYGNDIRMSNPDRVIGSILELV